MEWYGIAIGNFLSDDKKEINFAVSTTYGDYGEGQVFIFDRKYNEVHRISNNEVGSMYGATLCTLNLEGKRSSLLVGAPAYTTNHHEYDHGAVYLYVPDYSKNASKAMVLKRIIKGTSSSGYFGFSIANIGDIDGDGKDDVAIGAPYEDEGKGAVYVYSGHGLLTDSQHLKKIQSTKYTSFGFSLTPLTDSKENTIGLAVGAPFDNTVILYKVTPLITTKLYVQIPNLQAREDKTQFNFTACVNITYPRLTKTISTEIILRTEIIHPFAKLINAETNGSISDRVELRRRPPNYCKTYQVLTPETGNFGTMLKYNITTVVDDIKSKKSKIDGTKVDFSDISVRHLEGDIWAADCNITYGRCFPKLVVKPSSTLSDPYEVGLYDTERYFMTIKNVGETAYNLCFIVTLKGTHIANYPLHCTRTDAANQVICKLDDILPSDYSWMTSSIEIDTSFVTNKFDELEIQTDIYSNCTDRTDKQTIKETFKLIYNVTGINVDGIANPYKDINITTVDVVSGKFFEHLYMIRNGGGMDYENASFEVTLDKKDYLKWMLDEKIWNCSLFDSSETSMDDKIKYTCKIDNLHRYSDVNIHIPVQILPDSFGKHIKNENTITSSLTLKLKEEIKEKRLTTTLVYMSISVAAWIIILSILIGLIVLVLIALILREIGFFQRKNKKNLEDLKTVIRNESIRRQSQRQSNRDQTEQSHQTKQTEQLENDHCYDDDRKHFDSSDKLC
ncbi:integrin alpha-4-like [Melitaea cinxia]|uniref:integrin alpha-4-like n=1 Tax=Melitaea cinxia TaxID=113334 RepID=UPI001E27465A|nr:integrin alpha-4-like [Melitaea cinxia]